MTATTKATKQIIFRRRCNEGTRLLAEQVAKTDSHVILGGLLLITWRNIKRIRASFPKTSHPVYRLKRNEFLIWEWSKQHLPCPATECADAGPVLGNTIFEYAQDGVDTGSMFRIGEDGLVLFRTLICMSGHTKWTFLGVPQTPGMCIDQPLEPNADFPKN